MLSDAEGDAESTRHNGQAPLVVGGGIDGGAVEIPGDVSSQYITALLMAGAVSPDGIDIDLTTELKSSPYVDITLEVLDAFGVDAEKTDAGFTVDGGQTYVPDGGDYNVPGDFSSMSYLLAAGALAAEDGLQVTSAFPSAQGDAAIVDILDRMGADLDWDEEHGELAVSRSELTGIEVGVDDTPDLLPTIAALGAAPTATPDYRRRARPVQGDRPRERDGRGTRDDGRGGRRTPGRLPITARQRPRRHDRGRPCGPPHRHVAGRRRPRRRRRDDGDRRRTRRRVLPDFFDVLDSLGAAVEQ